MPIVEGHTGRRRSGAKPCEDAGTALATIESAAENEFVLGVLEKTTLPMTPHHHPLCTRHHPAQTSANTLTSPRTPHLPITSPKVTTCPPFCFPLAVALGNPPKERVR